MDIRNTSFNNEQKCMGIGNAAPLFMGNSAPPFLGNAAIRGMKPLPFSWVTTTRAMQPHCMAKQAIQLANWPMNSADQPGTSDSASTSSRETSPLILPTWKSGRWLTHPVSMDELHHRMAALAFYHFSIAYWLRTSLSSLGTNLAFIWEGSSDSDSEESLALTHGELGVYIVLFPNTPVWRWQLLHMWACHLRASCSSSAWMEWDPLFPVWAAPQEWTSRFWHTLRLQ